MKTLASIEQTKKLIDDLKSICAVYGLGNDGNEFKIITQIFLYKFLNDKFIYEVKKIDKKLSNSDNFFSELNSLKDKEFEMLLLQLNESTAILKPNQLINHIFEQQNEPNFSKIFDNNLIDISKQNIDIFSVLTDTGEKIVLFENISEFVTNKRDDFCKAIINKLVNFSFENLFDEKFDFFSTIFEYLIKDYNSNSGGKYAEYFTPYGVAKIMSSCLVDEKKNNLKCYDPSAGSGTLLMNLGNLIGDNNCIIYSQDISQKSSNLLRLNLILNNLVHSIPNIIQGNTILDPFHKDENNDLMKFDYVVSNPPFKLDFSEYIDQLDVKENKTRFFAGLPSVPPKDKDKMAIYPLFIQHIIYSLSKTGKAAIVVPRGFSTARNSIEKGIRKYLVENKMLRGFINMPSNIFAKTGTNVSILFIDNQKKDENVILIDATKLGITVKDGKNQKTLLQEQDQDLIISSFKNNKSKDDFSIVLSYEEIIEKDYSFNAGQYFEVKIDYKKLNEKEFLNQMQNFEKNLNNFFKKSKDLETEMNKELKKIDLKKDAF